MSLPLHPQPALPPHPSRRRGCGGFCGPRGQACQARLRPPSVSLGVRPGRRAESRLGAQLARAELTSEPTFSSPKAGAVGEERLRRGAAPGTYWSADLATTSGCPTPGTPILVDFITGIDAVRLQGLEGENLLRVAERAGVLRPTPEFCFEGSCCHCEMEVEGGAMEVGHRAFGSSDELVRSCICPLPQRRDNKLTVRVLSEEVWADGVV